MSVIKWNEENSEDIVNKWRALEGSSVKGVKGLFNG